MKRLIFLACLVCLPLMTTGCWHNQIIVDKNYNAAATAPDYENDWHMYLIMGLIDLGGDVNLTEVCGDRGAGIIEVEQSFLNGIVNGILQNLIVFQTDRVTCATGGSAAVETETPEVTTN